MDRRKLHKVNGQTFGKNRQISTRARANNRAAQQDTNREIEPEEVPVKLSRVERMKLWRLERDEKKKEEEQAKKKPFVTVVKRGVFLDKTNYAALNKQRRKILGTKKVNASQTLPVQARHLTATTINNVSVRRGGDLTETEVGRTDNNTENSAALLAVPDDSSALNSTFEMQTSDAADIVVESSNTPVHNVDVHSIATPAASVNVLTVPNVTSELNTTFEMENPVAETDMLTVPGNTSTLNTTFEMQNSVEMNGAWGTANQSLMGVSNILDAGHANDQSENIPVRRIPSIKSTPRSVKLENIPEGVGSSIKSTPKSVKVENIPAGVGSSIKSVKVENIAAESSIQSTPKSVLSTSLNYVSPFVTIGRGKGSAQKEVQVRESFYKLELTHPGNASPAVRHNRAAAEYFRKQVNSETNNLMQKVEYWTKYKEENDHIDSVYLDQIDVAIGQTRLLIAKKLKQFLGLCDECERGNSQPPVLPKDLEGFWSMVFMQVENCGLRFQNLVTLRESDWIEVELLPAKIPKQTRIRKAAKKGAVASSGIQKMIEEARLKLKENKINVTATSSSNADTGNRFPMTLRQTPARLSMSAVKTPRSIIKVKAPGVKRNTKSVAFSFIESPSTSSSQVAGTPNPRVIRRRASTSDVPAVKKTMTTDGVAAFLTPNNRKVTTATGTATSTDRRSSRRLFSNVEK